MTFITAEQLKDSPLTRAEMSAFIGQLVANMPEEWKGTTFKNDDKTYHGREGFANNLYSLMRDKKGKVTSEDLTAVGNAEDYLRVATNVSTTLEIALASPFKDLGIKSNQVFTIGSYKMGMLAVCLGQNPAKDAKTVEFWFPDGFPAGHEPFRKTPSGLDELELLRNANCIFNQRSQDECKAQLTQEKLAEKGPSNQINVVISKQDDEETLRKYLQSDFVDAVVTVHGGVFGSEENPPHTSVLYIREAKGDKIVLAGPSDHSMMTIRKRMATPATTPMALYMLKKFSGEEGAVEPACNDPEGEAEFYAHLQTMSGTEANPDCNPVIFTAGLPCIHAIYYALVTDGGADLLMCSTAYGGSSQVTDLMNQRAGKNKKFTKHTFDIQGSADIDKSIAGKLKNLEENREGLFKTLVLFVEIPTNPDMKVPDMGKIAEELQRYQTATGSRTLLLIDTTFSPPSKILETVRGAAPDLPAMVFISMSKSVSRGKTTAGCVVANHTDYSKSLCEGVRAASRMVDTFAKPDQMSILIKQHKGVEERCAGAYALQKVVGAALVQAVKEKTGKTMELSGITEEDRKRVPGITSSTFSFNLPPPEKSHDAIKGAMAQKFVDFLIEGNDKYRSASASGPEIYMKPCVSFGQDNGMTYCTVPATSTQGAIKAEDKAKQAQGGIQLVRLSFPAGLETADEHGVSISETDKENMGNIMKDAVNKIYDWHDEQCAFLSHLPMFS